MATTIVTKSGSGAPTASDLVAGELAVDLTNGRLYTEDSGGTVLELGLNPNGNVDVTGSVTADGLTVVAADAALAASIGSNGQRVYITPNGTEINYNASGNSAGSHMFQTGNIDRLNIAAGGDISFYEDTGTTPKLAWSAANERLTLTGSDYQFGIQQGANQPWYTRAVSDGTFRIHLNGTGDVLIADSSGNVGIGTSSPDRLIDLRTAPAEDWQIRLGANNTDLDTYDIGRDASDGLLHFYGNQTGYTGYVFDGINGERMRIDASGRVGIGMTANSGCLLNVNDHIRAENSAFLAGRETAALPAFAFHDDTDTGMFNVASNILAFSTAGTERMRIDSSGNLLVGKTANDNTTAGHRFTTSGFTSHVIANDYPLLLNRLSSDGALLTLRKDSVTVGSIASKDGDMTIGTGDTGIRFYDGGNGIYPVNASTQAGLDATIDLGRVDGSGTFRFKDLYLSGGVYLGGTGAANKLDDYEEGTFGPVLNSSGTTPTVTYSLQKGRYTKVGNLVTILVDCRWTANSGGTGNTTITGLPFANGDAYAGAIVFEHSSGWTYASGRTSLSAEVNQNTGIVTFIQNGSGLSGAGHDITTLGTTGYVIFSVTYRTA